MSATSPPARIDRSVAINPLPISESHSGNRIEGNYSRHAFAYVVPASAVSVVPEGVPPARAVLAGTVETAINALWDAAPAVGDRVAVVGGGMVGCCVARLLQRYPATCWTDRRPC